MLYPYDTAWNAIKSDAPTHIKINYFGSGVNITDEDIDISTGVTLTSSFNAATRLQIGNVACKQFTARILINDKTRYINFNSKFTVSFGVEIEDNTVWTTVGTFYGEKPALASTEYVDVIGYDNVINTDYVPKDFYDNLDLAFTQLGSISFSDIVGTLESATGFTITTYYSGLVNIQSRQYTTNPFADTRDYTVKELVSLISEACGCNIACNPYGAMQTKWFSTNYYTNIGYCISRDEEYYEEHSALYDGMTWNEFDGYKWNEAEQFTWDEITGYYELQNTIKGVSVIDGNNVVNYPTNVAEQDRVYVIKDNPFLSGITTQQDIDDYVVPLYERLASYSGSLNLVVESVGDWCVEPGDRIGVELPEGIIIMPVYYKTFTWNGSPRAIYETTSELGITVES